MFKKKISLTSRKSNKKNHKQNQKKTLPRMMHYGGYLSTGISHPIAQATGFTANLFDFKRRRIAQTNLELCFPKMSAQQRQALLKKNLIETAKTFFETPYFWQQIDAKRLKKIIVADEAKAAIDLALKNNKGLILAGPHFGSWEALGLWISSHYNITSLYRPQKGLLEEKILAARQRFGATLVPTTSGGVKTLLTALKRNEVIGILPDQDPPHQSGVFAPFFGIATHTATLLPKLAARSKAPVMVIWLQREYLRFGKARYVVHCKKVDDDIYNKDISIAAAALNQTLQTCIATCPEQYWWTYPRFRRTPEGSRPNYA